MGQASLQASPLVTLNALLLFHVQHGIEIGEEALLTEKGRIFFACDQDLTNLWRAVGCQLSFSCLDIKHRRIEVLPYPAEIGVESSTTGLGALE